MTDELEIHPEMMALRKVLRSSHPSFWRVDDILIGLAYDSTVAPAVFDRAAEAVSIVLMAYADAVNRIDSMDAAREREAATPASETGS